MKNENYEQMFEMLLKTEGKLLKGFSNFHNYSLGNQYWAMWQMMGRGLEISPIATFKKWQSLGRQVKKGSKAIALIMPVTIKDKDTGETKTVFIPKNNWFAMSQTEGEDVQFPQIGYDFDKALENLKVTKENFQHTNGNVLGYARKRTVAINPVGERPELTMFHELGHILLGHTEGDSEFVDEVTTQKNLKEVEAEGVALCCALALGLEGTEYCVGYINNWRKSAEVPADSIKKIFRVANEILRAGQEKPEKPVDNA